MGGVAVFACAVLFGEVGGGHGLRRGMEPALGVTALVVAVDGPVEAGGGVLPAQRARKKAQDGGRGGWARLSSRRHTLW